jgi:hypothetical protein
LAHHLHGVLHRLVRRNRRHIFPARAAHTPAGPPALFQYIFLPHIFTMLLTFVLVAFYIVHVFKNRALKDDRRVLWAVVLFMGGIVAAPIYWWLFIWRPLGGAAAV